MISAMQIGAVQQRAECEFERNRERYEFLKWGQKAFKNFSVVPPATGIVHQVNLEYLGQSRDGDATASRSPTAWSEPTAIPR